MLLIEASEWAGREQNRRKQTTELPAATWRFRHGVIADLLRTPPGRPQRAPSTLYRRMGNAGPTKRSAEPSENIQDRRHQMLSECPPRR